MALGRRTQGSVIPWSPTCTAWEETGDWGNDDLPQKWPDSLCNRKQVGKDLGDGSHSPLPRTRSSANQRCYFSTPAAPGMKSWLLLNKVSEARSQGSLENLLMTPSPRGPKVLCQNSGPCARGLINGFHRSALKCLRIWWALALCSSPTPKTRQKHMWGVQESVLHFLALRLLWNKNCSNSLQPKKENSL